MTFSLSGLDCLYITTACHVTTQFRLLNIKMSSLKVKIKRTYKWKAFSDVEIKSNIFELIQRHSHNFVIFDLLEKIYNTFMVTQFLQNTVVLCVIIYQFIDVSVQGLYTRMILSSMDFNCRFNLDNKLKCVHNSIVWVVCYNSRTSLRNLLDF